MATPTAIDSSKQIPPTRGHARCDLTVMLETHNSDAYIEEMVTYYLSHGARQLRVLDRSAKPDNLTRILHRYIQEGLVSYHHGRPFTRQIQQTDLTNTARAIINATLAERKNDAVVAGGRNYRPHWLITVDDDEYIFPSKIINKHNIENDTTLADFLCSPDVLEFPMVRFRWLSIPTHDGLARGTGKGAYHINHPNMTYSKWERQDPLDPSVGRYGGVFFLHGHNFRFTESELNTSSLKKFWKNPACLEAGYTFHFARSLAQRYQRTADWSRNETSGKAIKKNFGRDRNEVIYDRLAQWGQNMRDRGWVTFLPKGE
eukprot:CAMPEP_0168749230 /NCGR_PEP_ID=MMETSP0724-20121128/16599_1 /TAXON_ID=265536 /ORGANISM="Amphiprora sp., Strain CCMP467" /LENGTH=315 /DNA_ID=CAMNT_0008797113 /DNA_START=65 /DNA_END=1013 /DNA_ORIENTATION=+